MLAQRRLRRDIESLQGDLKRLMHDAKKIGTEDFPGVVSEMAESEQVKNLVKQTQESVARLKEQVKATGQKVETTIEEHPYAAIGAALGTGFVLGKLISLGRR